MFTSILCYPNNISNQTNDGRVQRFIEMVHQIVILMDLSQRP
jgi:hypothetical protein